MSSPTLSPKAEPRPLQPVEPAIAVSAVHKTYRLGRVDVPVLRGVDLEVKRGEWVAVLGASGSGKSTLLHLLGTLDRPDRQPAARVTIVGRDLDRMGRAETDRLRAASIGFVFQFYHLLPELTVLQNVTVGAMVRHGVGGYLRRRAKAVERAAELLTKLGLGARLKHRPAELSGGERQRVAIARALINGPELLLADEPTGNLDRETGRSILDELARHRAGSGITMVMATHDEEIARRADRVVRLQSGRVVAGSAGRAG